MAVEAVPEPPAAARLVFGDRLPLARRYVAHAAGWTLPLVRAGGVVVALKRACAQAEGDRDAAAVRRLGGGEPRIVRCGVEVVDPPSTVVVVERSRGTGRRTVRSRRREER